jgi:glycosyltransferase involved in cell wall biosynthesis
MKVTVVAPLFPLKSISPYCYYLIEALLKYFDFEYIGFTRTTFDFLYHGGSIDHTLKTMKPACVNARVQIDLYHPFSWIKAGLYASGNIVHLQHWKTSTTFMYTVIIPILKIRQKKILFSIHNITPHTPDKFLIFVDSILNRFVFHFADGFIVHNERNKQRFQELYKLKQRPIFVIGVGVHTPLITNNLSQKKAREHFQIPLKKKVLLNFGYLWEYKGMTVLLHALEMVVKEVPDVLLVIAGTATTNWKKYESIVQQKHLDNYIYKHLRYIPESEVDIYFAAADLVILPYIPPFDTHGGVGALAVALHKPLLVSDIGGLPEYVRDKRAIVRPGDPNELAQKIITILTDKSLLTSLKKDSKVIAKNITWDDIARKTLQVYEHLERTP